MEKGVLVGMPHMLVDCQKLLFLLCLAASRSLVEQRTVEGIENVLPLRIGYL